MKKQTIKAGEVYQVKVSGKLTEVRITGGNPNGGWDGINLATHKTVRLKSGARLRKPVSDGAKAAAAGPKKGKTAEHSAKPPTIAQDEKTVPVDESAASAAKVAPDRKMSGLDAAAEVLLDGGKMTARQIVEKMKISGLWSSDAKTPGATIVSAILREMKVKGAESRFRRAERGKFEHTGK